MLDFTSFRIYTTVNQKRMQAAMRRKQRREEDPGSGQSLLFNLCLSPEFCSISNKEWTTEKSSRERPSCSWNSMRGHGQRRLSRAAGCAFAHIALMQTEIDDFCCSDFAAGSFCKVLSPTTSLKQHKCVTWEFTSGLHSGEPETLLMILKFNWKKTRPVRQSRRMTTEWVICRLTACFKYI